jgi:hypothetical protein
LIRQVRVLTDSMVMILTAKDYEGKYRLRKLMCHYSAYKRDCHLPVSICVLYIQWVLMLKVL